MRRPFPYILIGFFALLSACNPLFKAQSLQYQNYRISTNLQKNERLTHLLQPYSDSINKTMNDIVGYAEITLEKKAPESTLGNFVADALLIMAREKYKSPVDAAFVNFGGIRLTQLAEGPVTKGKIFELMPFDNLLNLQTMKGSVLQQFLDLTAARGGWPLAGLTMEIKDRKAVNIRVNGKPLDPSADYIIANSDFVANGGDQADMLRAIPQQSTGYLVRDAIFDYINKLKNEGKNISAKIENRVSNAQ